MTAFKNRLRTLFFLLVMIPAAIVYAPLAGTYEFLREEVPDFAEFIKDAYKVAFRALIDGERVEF